MLGQKADPEKDRIEVSGKVMEARQEMLYYVMYKPSGVITSNVEGDRSDRGDRSERGDRGTHKKSSITSTPSTTSTTSPSIRDLLPPSLRGKIYPVGRLDKDSEGLLLLTNDGVLAYRLTHPKFDHEKEYAVSVAGEIKDGQLMKLREGLKLDGEKLKPAVVKRLSPSSFSIALTEGKNRQIRRMVQKVGGEVTMLKRVRIMTLTDTRLQPGQMRVLTEKERTQLLGAIAV